MIERLPSIPRDLKPEQQEEVYRTWLKKHNHEDWSTGDGMPPILIRRHGAVEVSENGSEKVRVVFIDGNQPHLGHMRGKGDSGRDETAVVEHTTKDGRREIVHDPILAQSVIDGDYEPKEQPVPIRRSA